MGAWVGRGVWGNPCMWSFSVVKFDCYLYIIMHIK